jgi:hypothetical protein
MPPYDSSITIDDNVSEGSVVTTETTDSCRIRDEADSLRREVCELRIRLEEVEEERNFHAAKANEMTSLFKFKGRNEVHEELVNKTLRVAELTTQVNKLKAEKTHIAEENAKLVRQRDATRKEMQDLTTVVRSLQTSAYSFEDDNYSDSGEEEDIILTPEKALDMTLGNMKDHIEVLEDAVQTRAVQCKIQKKKIALLKQDNEMMQVKIEMLEELFRELNQFRTDDGVRKGREALVSKSVETQQSTSRRQLFSKSLSVPALNISEKIRNARSSAKSNEPSIPSPVYAPPPKNLSEIQKRTGGQMKKIKICFKKAGLEGTYTGPMAEGLPHGVGTIRFTNGDTYLGEMTRGKMSGKGTLYSKRKGVFRGKFENNKFVGETQ